MKIFRLIDQNCAIAAHFKYREQNRFCNQSSPFVHIPGLRAAFTLQPSHRKIICRGHRLSWKASHNVMHNPHIKKVNRTNTGQLISSRNLAAVMMPAKFPSITIYWIRRPYPQYQPAPCRDSTSTSRYPPE